MRKKNHKTNPQKNIVKSHLLHTDFGNKKDHINWLRFFVIGMISFICTVSVIRLTPLVLHQLKTIPKIRLFTSSHEKKIRFLGNEKFTHIDPVLLKGFLDTQKKDILIVDIRSNAEYNAGHIKRAINIPLYTDYRRPYETLEDREKWISEIKKEGRSSPEIIVYGYRPDADLLLVSIERLRKERTGIKILSVGYGDWQGGFWNWIPGAEMNMTVNINDYIERVNQ